MDKANVFRSSSFHMDEGDILHMLFLDEDGVQIDVDLWNVDTDTETLPDTPTSLPASDITDSSFTANWYFNENTTGFYLDVATDSAFTAMVVGYNNLNVLNVNSYSVVGLSSSTEYFYRIRAYNNTGTSGNSNSLSAITATGVVTDIDGNIYTEVVIGTQVWMVENLKTTKYKDGTPIPDLTLNADWIAEDGTLGHDGAYCWYNNNIANKADYGGLYNWYAVNNAHGLAPSGWNIPTKADLELLFATIGGIHTPGLWDDAGGILKEIGITHWDAPNSGAIDTYGFKLLGGGSRIWWGGFMEQLLYATLWMSTDNDIDYPYDPELAYWSEIPYNDDWASTGYPRKQTGCSIRCMRYI
jgi:uncharacterized protein (TIGR02145 family)